MSAHTPEPWTAELTDDPEDGLDAYAVDCPEYSIALMDAPGGLELNEANARRIVACVNACAGIENEELEKLAALDCGLPGLAGVGQMALLNVLDRQNRDELAQCLRGYLLATTSGDPTLLEHADRQARAALAKVPA